VIDGADGGVTARVVMDGSGGDGNDWEGGAGGVVGGGAGGIGIDGCGCP